MGRYTNSGRVRSLYVGGTTLPGPVIDRLVKVSLSLSTSQTSQLVLSVADPDLQLLRANFMAKRTPVRYGDLSLEVAVRELVTVGSQTALQLTCRARGVQAMKRARGGQVWRHMSPTAWARMAAHSHGMRFVGEPTAVRRHIVRAHRRAGQPAESTWDVLQRLAQELGFIAFEAQEVIYFARPTWLTAHLPRVPVTWSGPTTTGHLLGVPQCRDSDDDTRRGYTGTLSVHVDLGEKLAPGHAVPLHGVGPFSVLYLATGLTMDLEGTSAASVTIETPVNPEPSGDPEKAKSRADSPSAARRRHRTKK